MNGKFFIYNKIFAKNFFEFKNRIKNNLVEDNLIINFCGFDEDIEKNSSKNLFVIINIILSTTGFILLVV
jgi:hypothetical protein